MRRARSGGRFGRRALAALALALAAPPFAGANPVAVDMTGSAFVPPTVTVDTGTTVEWTNLDPVLHTATATGGAFDSGALAHGDAFSHTFETAGTYDYVCAFHFGMSGSVVVSEPPPPSGFPSAVATANPARALVGQEVAFDGSASAPADGDSIVSWSWDFADGATASGVTAAHAFAEPGTYDVALTVTDEDGESDTASVSVEVALPTLRIRNATVREGDRRTRPARLALVLSAPVTHAVSVSFRTRNGTARAPRDYVAKAGKVTLAPGETSRTLRVAVRGDRRKERRERFTLRLATPAGATIEDAVGVATIRDDD